MVRSCGADASVVASWVGWIKTLASALVVSLGGIVYSAGAMGFNGLRRSEMKWEASCVSSQGVRGSVGKEGDFRSPFRSCEMGVRRCEVALMCLRVVSQLRNTLPNGVSAVKFPLNFAHSSSNGHNFFVSTPNQTPFEALDSWLPKLQKEIYYA